MTKDCNVPLAEMASDRVAGLYYKDIAAKYGKSVPMVRTLLRRAMKAGKVSAEQIRYKPAKPREAKPEGEYNAAWMQRVIANVTFDASGCWLWNGFKNEWGYAQTNYRGKTGSAHRLMYRVTHGVKLTRWQFVMHTCDVPHCVNPAHLRLGTPHDNVQDAADKGRHHNTRKTQCKRGHVYTEETVYITPDGTRSCKICHRGRMRLEAGWPEELAFSPEVVPHGHKLGNGSWKR